MALLFGIGPVVALTSATGASTTRTSARARRHNHRVVQATEGPNPKSGSALPSNCTIVGPTVTCMYAPNSPASQYLTVPQGIGSITVTLQGAKGGGGNNGGLGGSLSSTVLFPNGGSTSNQLGINVGLVGGYNGSQTTGGWPDGGSGGSGGANPGCGGGGGTQVWDGTTLLAEAAGGGGCGGYGAGGSPVAGGAGGGATGASGTGGNYGDKICTGAGAGGGGGTSGGSGGSGSCSAKGGGSGGQTGGGGGGNAAANGGGGGGGGGGWYGGGGGGGGTLGLSTGQSGGGGGGGSSSCINCYATSTSTGMQNGPGLAEIQWNLLSSSVSLTSNTSSTTVGGPVQLTATISAFGYVPTGTVNFSGPNGPIPSCQNVQLVTTSSDSSATCTTAAPVLGADQYTAVYTGTDVVAPGNASVSVAAAVNTTSTADVSATLNSPQDSQFQLQTTVTPGEYWAAPKGLVTFDYSVAFGSGPPSSGVACSQSFSSTPGTGPPPSATTVGCNMTTGVTPGGTYSFTATYGGDVNDLGSSSPSATIYSVPKASTTTTLSLAPGSSSTLVYGNQETVGTTVSGIPASDTSPGTVSYQYADGTLVDCAGSGTTPVAVSPSGSVPNCTFAPSVTEDRVVAVYSGDSQSDSSRSQPLGFTVSPAPTSTSVAVTAAGNAPVVGVPITISATIENADGTGPGPDGVVAFFENGAPIPGCASVPASPAAGLLNTSAATCSSAPAPGSVSPESFSATYCSVTSATNCADWVTSTATPVTYVPGPDPTTTTLVPTAPQDSPISALGGAPVTVTATVAVGTGTAIPRGTVSFFDNGNHIGSFAGTSGGSCTALALKVSGRTGTAVCTFVPLDGTLNSIVANYNQAPTTDPDTAGSTSATTTPLYYKVSGSPTTTSVDVSGPSGVLPNGASVGYGVPLTLKAVVTSAGATVDEGTVDFTLGGKPLTTNGALVCQNVPVATGVATCATPLELPPGTATIGAAYGDASQGFRSSTAAGTSLHVTADGTATSVTVGPDPAHIGDTVVTATVSDKSAGSLAAPLGTVSFQVGSAASCASVPTTASPGAATSTATCTIVAGSGPRTYSASYAPASGDFVASSSVPVTYPTASKCSVTFAALWSDATGTGSSVALHLGAFATAADSGALHLSGASGGCDPAAAIAIDGGTFSLMGRTLVSAGPRPLSGYIEDASAPGGDPTLCLTGGQLDLPAGWHLAPLVLGGAGAGELCFSITSAAAGSSPGLNLGPVAKAQLGIAAVSLPFGAPSGSLGYAASISFSATAPAGSCSTSPDQMLLDLAPSTSPGANPYIDASVVVSVAAGKAQACGTLSLGNLFTGGTVSGSVGVSAGSNGSLAGRVTLSAADVSSPISFAPGVSLEDVTATLSSSSGLTISAAGLIGSPSKAMRVSLVGSYKASDWRLLVSGATGLAWSPFSSLHFADLTLTGSISITTAGSVSFDIEAGAPPTGPGAGTALVAWDPVAGVSVGIDCLAFAYGATPACGAGLPGSHLPTDAVMVVEGFVSAGSSFTAGMGGTIDLTAGSFSLSYEPTLSNSSITIVNGLTVSLTSLTLSGSIGGGASLDGVASADIPALQSSPLPVTISNASGALVVAVAGINLSQAGVPVSGFFAYASGSVSGFDTGMSALGTVDLSSGFNAFGIYTPSAAVANVLASAGLKLPSGDAVEFSASWAPGTTPTFTAALAAPSGFPFLTLPGGATLTAATLSFRADRLTFAAFGSVPIPNSSPANIALSVLISGDGSFNGQVTASGFLILGQAVGFIGSISRSASGTISADVQSCQPAPGGSCIAGPITGPFTPFGGVPLQLSDVSFVLGTSGISVSGTASIDGLGSLSVTGSLSSLRTWSVTVAASQAQSWQPAPGVVIDAEFTGTLQDTHGVVGFSLSAAGANSGNLFTLSAGGVTVAVDSAQLGNLTPPATCSVATLGDLYLSVSGSLSVSLGSLSGSASAAGCFDLTTNSLDLSATVNSLDFTAAGVSLNGPTVTLSEGSGKYSVAAQVPMTVSLPSGGSLSLVGTLAFESGGAFVAGVETNLSQWLGAAGDTAYVYYASEHVTGFVTGDPSLQPITLASGVDFALAVTVPTQVISGLQVIGIDLPSTSGLTAVGNVNLSTGAFTFKVIVSFGTGMTLFSSGGSSLVLDNGYLKVQVGGGQFEFGVGMAATLDVPAAEASGSASSVPVSGELDITSTGIVASLSIGTCGVPGTAWSTAFGVSNLTVECAAIQGGISFEGIPTIGLEGTISSLPSSISNAIGYQDGSPITFAFNLNPFLLDLSIGTKNSGTVALEPFAAFGQASLLEVDYARLYISPSGATIGQTVYPAGFGLDFQGSIKGVQISVLADVGLSPPSIHFTGSISQITIGSFSMGPVVLKIDASPTSFLFQFQGSVSYGPAMGNIGPDLQVGGSVAATVQVEASTSGFSAYIKGQLALSVATYVPTGVCYSYGVPYPCDLQWESTSSSVVIHRTGFSATGSGITLIADGYSVTFNFNGTVSSSLASYTTARGSSGGHGRLGAQLLAAISKRPQSGRRPGPRNRTAPHNEVLLSTRSRSRRASSRSHPPPGSSPATAIPVREGLAARSAKVGSSSAPAPPLGMFASTGALAGPRAFAASATLRNGEVLVAGGIGRSGSVRASAEVYDPASGRWRVVGRMTTARFGAAADLLPNGEVLVAGGMGAGGRPLSSAELFDPATGSWHDVGPMPGARAFPVVAALSDGDLLLAGGVGAGHSALASAVLYDPSTRRWSETAPMGTARAFASGAALPAGGALVAGGYGPGGALSSAEVFHPGSNSWSAAGSMASPRFMTAAAQLGDGDVLVVGDGPDAQRYDPATNSWSSTQQSGSPSVLPSLAALPGGEVLSLGGDTGGTASATASIYEPATNSWASAGTMAARRYAMTAAALADGEVLVAGGATLTRSGRVTSLVPEAGAELYSPSGHLSSMTVKDPVSAPTPSVVTGNPRNGSLGWVLGVVIAGGLLLAIGGIGMTARRRRHS